MSVSFFGDYDTTETVHIPFNTFSSDDPSASVTITNLAAADVEIHKDGALVQRASDNGVTVSIDFDTVTGNHLVAIDLSDNSDAGFYAAGSRYQVRMEGTTVDGATINAWIGAFSIGCTLRPTTAGNTLDVTATGAAGIDWGNVENQGTTVNLSATTTNLVNTTTTNTDMRGTDNALLAASVNVSGGVVESNLQQIGGVIQSAVDLKDFADVGYDPATNKVQGVVLVDTTTTNTDMRGTDSALLAASAPTNWSDLAITVTTGYVTVGTNNDKTGYTVSTVSDKTGYSISGAKTTLDALNDISSANVNTEVSDVLKTDTVTLPGQIAPPATPTLEQAISWLYKVMRNKTDQTSTLWQLYDDAGTTVDTKATVSESGGTATKNELQSGP